MNHARDQLLAGAGLAFDQHGRVGGRDPRERLIDLDHARRAADHFRIRQVVDGGGFVLILGRAQRLFGAPDGLDHLRHLERLGQILERPALGRRHHRFHAAASGHQDHGAQRVLFARGVQHIDAGALVQINVGDHDGIGLRRQPLDRLARRADRLGLVALQLQHGHHGVPYRRVILDDQ